MSASNSLPIDAVPPRRHVAGQLAYAALFALVLPLLLTAWASALERRVALPAVGSRPLGVTLAVCGALLMALAAISLRMKGGGWPMSPFPPRRLVTIGVHSLVADPLYPRAVPVVF